MATHSTYMQFICVHENGMSPSSTFVQISSQLISLSEHTSHMYTHAFVAFHQFCLRSVVKLQVYYYCNTMYHFTLYNYSEESLNNNILVA